MQMIIPPTNHLTQPSITSMTCHKLSINPTQTNPQVLLTNSTCHFLSQTKPTLITIIRTPCEISFPRTSPKSQQGCETVLVKRRTILGKSLEYPIKDRYIMGRGVQGLRKPELFNSFPPPRQIRSRLVRGTHRGVRNGVFI